MRSYPTAMEAVAAPLNTVPAQTQTLAYQTRSVENTQVFTPSQSTLASPVQQFDRPRESGSDHTHVGRELDLEKQTDPAFDRQANGSDQVHLRSEDPNVDDVYVSKKHIRALEIKNHFLAFVGELVGTTLFMYFALAATNVANLPATTVTGITSTSAITGDATTVLNTSSLLYIALAFGFSLAICAWIFFRVSGGLFNPAVSLGLLLVGVITPVRAILLTIAQCAGAIAGAGFVQLTLPGDLNATTRLAPGTSVVQGLFIEMFCTSLLMFAVLFLAAEKSKATVRYPASRMTMTDEILVFGSHWNRSCFVHRRNGRSPLHWRLS